MSDWPFDHKSRIDSATLKIVFVATGICASTLLHASRILVEFRCRERYCYALYVSAVPVEVVDVKTNVDSTYHQSGFFILCESLPPLGLLPDGRRAVSARAARGLESPRTTPAALDGVCTGTRTSGFEPSHWDLRAGCDPVRVREHGSDGSCR